MELEGVRGIGPQEGMLRLEILFTHFKIIFFSFFNFKITIIIVGGGFKLPLFVINNNHKSSPNGRVTERIH